MHWRRRWRSPCCSARSPRRPRPAGRRRGSRASSRSYTAAKMKVTGKLTSLGVPVAAQVRRPGEVRGAQAVRVARIKTDAHGAFTLTMLGGERYRVAFAGDAQLSPAAVVTKVSGPTDGGSCAACHTSSSRSGGVPGLTAGGRRQARAVRRVPGGHPRDEGLLGLSQGRPARRRPRTPRTAACAPTRPTTARRLSAPPATPRSPPNTGRRLHNTTNGLKNAFFGRLRNAPDEAHKSWRSKACVDCHASCGACHVARPRDPWVTSGPKGLLAGHEFLDYEKAATDTRAPATSATPARSPTLRRVPEVRRARHQRLHAA